MELKTKKKEDPELVENEYILLVDHENTVMFKAPVICNLKKERITISAYAIRALIKEVVTMRGLPYKLALHREEKQIETTIEEWEI